MFARISTSMWIALGLLVNGMSARADEDDRTERASKASVSTAVRPEPQLEYYGWQIMSVDVASLLVGLAIPDYWYFRGFNPVALFSWAIGFATYEIIEISRASPGASLPSLLVAGLVYYLLTYWGRR